MRSVAVADLRQNLSKYLEAVEKGEELLVTERGRPIARIIPVTGAHAQDSHMLGLIRTGVLRPRARDLAGDFWARAKPRDPEGAVLKALLEERQEGR